MPRMLLLPDTPHTEAVATDTLCAQAPAPAIELEQPISQELCGEMLDVELPWCSFDRGFRGYAESSSESSWWSTSGATEMAPSFG